MASRSNLSSAANESDADEEDTFDELAALAMTSLLSLDATTPKPVETIDGEACPAGSEIGEASAIDQVTSPDSLIDVNARAEGEQAAANI